LLTYGNKALQQKKIKQSGLAIFFKEVIISSDHTKIQPLKKLQSKYPNLLFIDNSKHIYNSAKTLSIPTL
jgi:FMN phosphatase YigB (HAD superfamily)